LIFSSRFLMLWAKQKKKKRNNSHLFIDII
jgi:hypothetical protein